MKVLHISPSFYPAGHYGGPVYSGYSLCNSLAQIANIELRVLTTDSDGPKRIRTPGNPSRLPGGYDAFYCRRWLRPDIAPGMFLRLYSMIRWADVVHLTAVYSAPTIPTLLICRLLHKPVVWTTRGALQRWNSSTRTGLKAVWEKICNSLCDPQRVLLHATSDEEMLESIQRIPDVRAVVIPNGIELPTLNGRRAAANPGELHLLYLGRLHPIKGIENLLSVMPKLKQRATLSICGEGEGDYQKQLQSLVADLGLEGSVKFHGRVEGAIKEERFAEADLCIVPSHKENFCLVVAEALARGVPVIASLGTPWKRIEEVGCGMWVNNDPESLADAIDRIARMPLREMGEHGRKWMKEEYSWDAIAEAMAAKYRELVAASQREVAASAGKHKTA